MSLQFKELDVTSILASGVDPFLTIMATVDGLVPGEGLLLRAPFEPRPLFAVMEGKGYDHASSKLSDTEYEVRFSPRATKVLGSENAVEADVWPDPVVDLDLTDLDPPQPMVRILATLETMSPGEVLFAVLGREPIFLFPELVKRGHQWVGNFDATGEAFRMMIRRGEARS